MFLHLWGGVFFCRTCRFQSLRKLGDVMKMRELDIAVFIQLIVYAVLGKNITVLVSCQVFDERVLYQVFLHGAFHFGVRQGRQKLIIH